MDIQEATSINDIDNEKDDDSGLFSIANDFHDVDNLYIDDTNSDTKKEYNTVTEEKKDLYAVRLRRTPTNKAESAG